MFTFTDKIKEKYKVLNEEEVREKTGVEHLWIAVSFQMQEIHLDEPSEELIHSLGIQLLYYSICPPTIKDLWLNLIVGCSISTDVSHFLEYEEFWFIFPQIILFSLICRLV